MSFEIRTIPPFDRQAKRLAKKYRSLKSDLLALAGMLRERPEHGSPLGNGCFKVRMAITSKGRGRSGGARVITHLIVRQQRIYLLAIYDKSERSSLSDKEIKELIEQIPG